jgi:hypothetical protein
MTTLLRVQANRRNALKSTGPRTVGGKARSSCNAIRHGLRTWKPVLLPGESPAAWKKFAQAVLEDLGPRGAVQMMWAGRAALLMWRLRSAVDARKVLLDQQWREAEVLAPKSAWWEHLNERNQSLPSSLESIREKLAKSKRQQSLLARAAALPDGASPEEASFADSVTAPDLIEWAAEHLDVADRLCKEMQKERHPGIGPLAASPDPDRYHWTLGMVREGLTEVAAWKKETYRGLLATLIPAMRQAHRSMQAARRRGEREMRRFRLCSAARAPESFEKFDRYEAMLQRGLAQALSQLRSLQSQTPEETSVNAGETSRNVVQMGFVSLETQEKQG